jgi:hypothetical protein
VTTVRQCAELLETALGQSSDAAPISGGTRERLEVLRAHVKTAVGFLRELVNNGVTHSADYEIELKGPVDVELYNPLVAHDEVDEDPKQLYAIDADDPDDGHNTIPVDDLAGCHVEIRALPGDAPADVGEQGPEQA